MNRYTLDNNARLRYFTFFYLYIMQGIPAGFALTALANYLVGKNVPSEQVGSFIAVVGLPWILQFLWGPLIDRYQYSSMGNRKHWIVFSQWATVGVTACLLVIHEPEKHLSLLGTIFCTNSIFASVQVASADAMAITITPDTERGRMNGYMRGGFLLGTAFSAAVFSSMLHRYGFQVTALLQSLILVFFSLLFFFTKIKTTDSLFLSLQNTKRELPASPDNPPFKLVFRNIYAGITARQSLVYLGLIALLYFCSSVFIRSYTFYLINVLRWSDNTVSLLQGGWGSGVTFMAILFAGSQSDKLGPKYLQIKVMWFVCIFLLLINCSFQYWRFSYYSGFALVAWNLADPLLSVCIFPILMGLCLKKVEGSQFTTYLAIINLCDVLGAYVTGWSLKIISAPAIGFACGLALLLLLVVLRTNKRYSAIPDRLPAQVSV